MYPNVSQTNIVSLLFMPNKEAMSDQSNSSFTDGAEAADDNTITKERINTLTVHTFSENGVYYFFSYCIVVLTFTLN